MSRFNFDSVVEMLKEAIANKNALIRAETETLLKCGYVGEIVKRSQTISVLISGRDALLELLHHIHKKEDGL